VHGRLRNLFPLRMNRRSSMHVKGIIQKMLLKVVHNKRLKTLTLLTETVLENKHLSLTELGRGLNLPIHERSGIRRVDRFLGNCHLHQERKSIYSTIIPWVVSKKMRPIIIIDWSPVPNTSHHVLRAALVSKGRAITLYEEVHPENKQENSQVHCDFLRQLKAFLGETCKPIIITDAGFHNDWFREVENLNWDYIGRIRGVKYFRKLGKTNWQKCNQLHAKATSRPRLIGKVELCKANSLTTNFYLYKGKSKKRKALKGKATRNGTKYRKSAKEPWLLSTSLKERHGSENRVIKLYGLRMRIEEGFRDLKSSQYGFGLEKAHSKKVERIEILLLIGMLGTLIAWLTGWVCEKENIHYQFQSNTIKNRRVLSLFWLGCRAIKKKIDIPLSQVFNVLNMGIGVEK
jgi:hypothetical protein